MSTHFEYYILWTNNKTTKKKNQNQSEKPNSLLSSCYVTSKSLNPIGFDFNNKKKNCLCYILKSYNNLYGQFNYDKCPINIC